MKLWTRLVVYVVAMFLTLACDSNGRSPIAPSQPPAGPTVVTSFTVFGCVFDGTDQSSRKPAGVRVSVNGAYQAVTDENGYYRINRIDGPVCELEAVEEGYVSASRIISLDAAEQRVDFDLKKRGDAGGSHDA